MHTDEIMGTQFTVLAFLDRDGARTMEQLSESLHLERTSLVRKLAPMFENGLIERVDAPSAKAKPIQITAAGQAVLDEALPQWEKTQQIIRDRLSTEEWECFNRCLQKLSGLGSETSV
jgi:DNA-binding MarR family transcriptional regulator